MTLEVGTKVIYPTQGPCLIGSVVDKEVAGRPVSFYHLELLDESGGDLFVPVEKAHSVGLRLLLNRSEIPKLMAHLRKSCTIVKDWKQRAHYNLKLMNSGSAFDLAEIVDSLTELNERKSLSFRESWMLERAKRLLVCEISEVLGETKVAAEKQVDQALKAGRKRANPANP